MSTFRRELLAVCILGCASSGSERPEPGVPFGVVRRQNHRIELGELALEVDAVDGGRIVEFSLKGRNVLASRSESAQAYGSSFWPSPQRDWSWPPPPELDALPWQVSVEGAELVLRSAINQKLGLSATQRISALMDRDAVRIELTLTNHGAQPRAVAAWQNTRMRPSGLTFFPMTGSALSPSAFALEPVAGIAWFAHAPGDDLRKGKLFADGEEGWLAHLDGDLLFVKTFPPVERSKQAPGEAEIELYVDPGGVFVEIEQQGPYAPILPGQSVTWRCHWQLVRVDPSARRRPGDERLVAQVRSLVRRLE